MGRFAPPPRRWESNRRASSRPSGEIAPLVAVGVRPEGHDSRLSCDWPAASTGREDRRVSVSRTPEELDAGLAAIRDAPRDVGTLELIVRRPAIGEREVLEIAELSTTDGLVGDSWKTRRNKRAADGRPDPDKQINVMGARVASLVAVDPDRRALAGDQLYVDLDLSEDNLPAGTRLRIGDAVIEVTPPPHRGCVKFTNRFGRDAMRFVNSKEGRALRLRGLNAKVVVPGTIRRGDAVLKE